MDRAVPDLLARASSLLAREAARLPGAFTAGPLSAGSLPAAQLPGGLPSDAVLAKGSGAPACPITGATLPGEELLPSALRVQAHELVESLLGAAGSVGGGGSEATTAAAPYALLGKVCPVTHAGPEIPAFDRDRLRQQAHQFIETLLITFNDATGEKGLPAEDQVPLIRPATPVQPGSVARVPVRISNEEAVPAEVTLYSSNFVADCGYDIPSLRVTMSPRRQTIPPGGSSSFEVSVAVPQQTPRGIYSGLIQAMGNTYFKAVLCVDVL